MYNVLQKQERIRESNKSRPKSNPKHKPGNPINTRKTSFEIQQPTLSDISNEILNTIQSELFKIDSETMLENLVNLLNSIQEEVSEKFAHSKYSQMIQDIFDKNLEIILNYFVHCLKQTDEIKTSALDILSNCLSSLCKEDNPSQIVSSVPTTESSLATDEEFVYLINSLSGSIKDFMRNTKNCIRLLTSNSESSMEKLIQSKALISDITLQSSLVQQAKTQLKIIKEKASSLALRNEEMSQIRKEVTKNTRHIDGYCAKFYEDAKGIFKKLKLLHNEKISEIQYLNSQYKEESSKSIHKSSKELKIRRESLSSFGHTGLNTSGSFIGNISSTPIQHSKSFSRNFGGTPIRLGTDSYPELEIGVSKSTTNSNKVENAFAYDNRLSSDDISKMNNVVLSVQIEKLTSRNRELLQEIANLHEQFVNVQYDNENLRQEIEQMRENIRSNTNSNQEDNSISITMQNVSEKVRKSKNLSLSTKETPYKLGALVLDFISKMNLLQESICKKASNTSELKKEFEKKKKLMIKLAKEIHNDNEMLDENFVDSPAEKDGSSKSINFNFEQMVSSKELQILQVENNSLKNEINLLKDEISEMISKLNSTKQETSKTIEEKDEMISKLHNESQMLSEKLRIIQTDMLIKEEVIENKENELEMIRKEYEEKIAIIKNDFDHHEKNLFDQIEKLKSNQESSVVILEQENRDNKLKIKELQNTYNSIRDEHNNEINNLNIQIEKKKEENQKLLDMNLLAQDKIKELDQRLYDTNTKNLDEITKLNSILCDLNYELESKDGENSTLTQKLKEITTHNEEIISINIDQIKELNLIVSEKDYKILKLNSDVAELEETLMKKEDELMQLKSSIQENKDEQVLNYIQMLNNKDEDIKSLNHRIKEGLNMIEQLETSNHVKCREWNTILSEKENHIKDLNEELNNKESKLVLLNQNLLTKEEEISNLNKTFSEFKTYSENLLKDQEYKLMKTNQDQEDEITRIQTKNINEIDKLKKDNELEISKLTTFIEELRLKYDNDTNSLKEANKELAKKFQMEINTIKAEMKIKYENDIGKIISEMDDTSKEKINKLHDDILSKDKQIESLVEQIGQMCTDKEIQINRIEELTKKVETKETKLNNLHIKYEELLKLKNITKQERDLLIQRELELQSEIYNVIKEKNTLKEDFNVETEKLFKDNNELVMQVKSLEHKIAECQIQHVAKDELITKLTNDIETNRLNDKEKENEELITLSKTNHELDIAIKGKQDEIRELNELYLKEKEKFSQSLIKLEDKKVELNKVLSDHNSKEEHLIKITNENDCKISKLNQKLSLGTQMFNKLYNKSMSIYTKINKDATFEIDFPLTSHNLQEESDEDINTLSKYEEIILIFDKIYTSHSRLKEENHEIMERYTKFKQDMIEIENEEISQLKDENRIMKKIFKQCTGVIYDTIKSSAPDMFEDDPGFHMTNEDEDEFVLPSEEYLSTAVEMFRKYNHKMIDDISSITQERDQFLIDVNNYKQTLDQMKLKLKSSIENRVDQHIKDKEHLTNRSGEFNNTHTFTVEDLVEDNKQTKENEMNIFAASRTELLHRMTLKEEEIINLRETINKLLLVSDKTKPVHYEKYEILLHMYNEEQEILKETTLSLNAVKEEFEKFKQEYSNDLRRNEFNEPPLTLGNRNQKDEQEIIIVQPRGMLNRTAGQIKLQDDNYLSMLNQPEKDCAYIKSQVSLRSQNDYMQEFVMEAEERLEEQENLFAEQLKQLKAELKLTREQRDTYKRQLEESITWQAGEKREIINMMKHAIEKLIGEISITPKIKEYLTVILRVLGYSDDEILYIYRLKDQQRKGFLGLFG